MSVSIAGTGYLSSPAVHGVSGNAVRTFMDEAKDRVPARSRGMGETTPVPPVPVVDVKYRGRFG
jgi:hypothetical protein